jgi:hypothetical protein
MKIVMSLATAAMVIAYGAGAMAAELPSYEVAGFPISPVQVQLVGAARVQNSRRLPPGRLTARRPRRIRSASSRRAGNAPPLRSPPT